MLVARPQAPEQLTAEALDGRRRDDALGGAPDPPQQVDGRALGDGEQRRRDVAVRDQPHARTGRADRLHALRVARAVQHHDHHVADLAALALGDQRERLRQRPVEVEQVGDLRGAGHLLHVDARARVEHRAAAGERDHGERARHPVGGERRALQRIDRDVDLGRRAVADALAVVEHRRLVLLALADHDDAVHLDGVQRVAHAVDRGLVGGLLVAFADQRRRGERRGLGDARKLEGEIAIGLLGGGVGAQVDTFRCAVRAKPTPSGGAVTVEEAENPLVEGLERLPVSPTTLVIFGATGDLARRKLLPALYNLAHEGALPERFNLVGVSRKDKERDDYRAECEEAIRSFSRRTPDEDVLAGLLEHVKYVPGTFDDPAVYEELERALDGFEEQAGEKLGRAFYLSTAPSFFPVIVEALGRQGLSQREGADVRVIIEKPFGTSLAEATELNRDVLAVFDESQVFRIDHYLGKETVQNMLAFRFANGMFEPLWNRNYIEHVQITAAEDIGIGSRAGYYDHSGALRDLIQNHMLQLLCHVAMEPPVNFTSEEVRNEKVKILQAIHAPTPQDIEEMAVRAQYAAGHAGGEDVLGYLEEDGVREHSNTETFAALRLEVDNWRWAGVPFYLRAGKRLARKITEIAITLKPVPHLAFNQEGSLGIKPNQLILTLQPNEGVSLQLGAKIPGTRMIIRPVNMEFLYGTAFLSQSPEAYERLIMDAMRGDPTLFTRNDEVEAQWQICDPIVNAWEAAPGPLPQYEAGSQGPPEAASILREGHSWRAI